MLQVRRCGCLPLRKLHKTADKSCLPTPRFSLKKKDTSTMLLSKPIINCTENPFTTNEVPGTFINVIVERKGRHANTSLPILSSNRYIHVRGFVSANAICNIDTNSIFGNLSILRDLHCPPVYCACPQTSNPPTLLHCLYNL